MRRRSGCGWRERPNHARRGWSRIDVGNDLALLRIAGTGFPAARFAAPGAIAIGDEVVAIGFALDLDGQPSVTLGIVSGLDRTVKSKNGALDGLIQTDAAILVG